MLSIDDWKSGGNGLLRILKCDKLRLSFTYKDQFSGTSKWLKK